jgi:hypothetical protein
MKLRQQRLFSVLLGGAAALLAGAMLASNGWASSKETSELIEHTGDTELATVALIKDGEGDILAKLGANHCTVPGSSQGTLAYLYRTADGRYLRFMVNKAPSDVDYGRIEAMTMSVNPVVSGACYQPVSGSLNGHSVNVGTRFGVHLGDSIEKVKAVYGNPAETRADGSRTLTARYQWDREIDHYYDWHLVFRDGRLVEWTAEAIPYFIEMPG